jgi:hypothetical protein
LSLILHVFTHVLVLQLYTLLSFNIQCWPAVLAGTGQS